MVLKSKNIVFYKNNLKINKKNEKNSYGESDPQNNQRITTPNDFMFFSNCSLENEEIMYPFFDKVSNPFCAVIGLF